jgi:hypothetical protein
MMSGEKLIHVKPAKSLRFEPEKWNDRDVQNLRHGSDAYIYQTIRAWQESCRGFVSRGNLSSLFARGVAEGAGFEAINEVEAHNPASPKEHIFAYLPAFEHFIRRDYAGTWSHKLGPLKAVNTDDAGEKIMNLSEARWRHADSKFFCWNFTDKPFDRYATYEEVPAPNRLIQYYRVPQSGVRIEPNYSIGW